MRTLTTIPTRHAQRVRAATALARAARPALGVHEPVHGFAPLLDAKAAGELLGVPHTWLLAQARAGRIPHHRLGHYVRFNTEDLKEWLTQTRSMPDRRF
jgi:excisionase family DNA binding protein